MPNHGCCELCGSPLSRDNEFDNFDRITKWLDDHPDYTWSYFNLRTNFPSTDLWPVVHSDEPLSNLEQSVISHSGPSVSTSPQVSLPMRKVSTHDFEFSGNQRILSSSPDGKPTFIPQDFYSFTYPLNRGDETRSPRKEFSHMVSAISGNQDNSSVCQERDLINELVLDVCNELDITALCFKIIQNVCILVEADRGSLFLVDHDRATGAKILVSKLFDVTPECALEDILRRSESRRIVVPFSVGISGHVAQTGEYANISDAYSDPRFFDVVDRETGYRTKCILCMPIKNFSGEVLAVALIINKRIRSGPNTSIETNLPNSLPTPEDGFTDRDVRLFKSYVAFCGIGLHNAKIYQKSRLETYRNQVLLELARIIFTEHSDLSRLIYTVLAHTVSLLRCQRSQILLVAEEDELNEETTRFSHAFNLTCNQIKNNEEFGETDNSVEHSDFPVQFTIAQTVVRTAETLNIIDVKSDPNFDSSIEEQLDPVWRTKTLLCVPIKHSDGHVLAVCFLVNKFVESLQTSVDCTAGNTTTTTTVGDAVSSDWSGAFSDADEALFEAFALFAGLGISNRQMYDRVVQSVAKQRVLLDVLAYHATAPKSEAKCLANSLIPSCKFYQLDSFSFTDINLTEEATLKASVRMFLDMRFMKTFKLDMLSLCRWVLSVKKNYREVTYHNWRHAFNVTQTMFAVLTNANLQSLFSDLECLAFLIACLAHDVDHRGTDNQFQIKTMSPLAQLYSTSVLEHHHFNQCMMLISRKGNDFLSSLSRPDYRLVISLVKEDILATDLSRYFARLPDFQRILETRSTHPVDCSSEFVREPWSTQTEKRGLLSCMLMTSCDLAAITKPWPVQKMIAELVTAEFLEQGDLEKDKLHTQPRDLMDRDQVHQLPTLQISFIDSVCLPVYKAIAQVSSALRPLLDGCLRNRDCWVHLAEGREIPSSLFGLPPDGKDDSLDSAALARLGTINPTRIRQIMSTKPFESTPARRVSTGMATTVGGDQDLSPGSTTTDRCVD